MSQKPVLIVENSNQSLIINENAKQKNEYILGGEFTRFNEKNRNDRIYKAEKFLPALQELNERISSLGVVFGELDHSETFDLSLTKCSHIIRKATYVKENNRVDGEIKLLSTYYGKEARAIVDDGCPLFVSSRAAGITENNGEVAIKKLFTYDIVADPGFASAKMSCINESCGFGDPSSTKANFRIYEMSDESKINQMFNMNKNDFVTKRDLTDYSKYLIKEIATTKDEVKKAIKSGSMEPSKLDSLLENYEELQKANKKLVKYLDYLAEKIQVVVDENISMKSIQEKLISHNDYIAENLSNSIEYAEYVSESVEDAISYTQYVGEQVDKTIEYSEYVAEQAERGIEYSEYIGEQVESTISYTEYIAENLENNIAYGEYIAEHIDNNIQYAEYLAEHVEGNIAYSEYIAENLGDNIAYGEYIAEGLDKSLIYTDSIVTKLNEGKILENNSGNKLPSLEEFGIKSVNEDYDEEEYYEEEEEEDEDGIDEIGVEKKCTCGNVPCTCKEKMTFGDEDENPSEEESPEFVSEEDEISTVESKKSVSDTELSKQIDILIEEAKKRKVSETSDLHFLKFLNKNQVDSFYGLENQEQEQVKLYLNEKKYYSNSEVIKLITEALAVTNESLEDRLIRLMPEQIKPIWSQLNESSKKSVLSQGRLYPNLENDSNIEHFWLTRQLKKNESVTKQLLAKESIINEDVLSDTDFVAIMEKLKRLS